MGGDRRSNTSCWMDLFVPETCLPQLDLMWSSKNGEWELLWDHSQEAGQTSHIRMEIQFLRRFPSAHPTPKRRPPTGNIADSTFRAPQRGSDPVDEGRPDTEGFSGPSRRSGPTVRTNTCLWLSTPGRACRNCRWMWAPSRWYEAKETRIQGGCV